MGAGPLKKGAMTPHSRKKGVPAKKIIPKCTDQIFRWYWFNKYQEIPTEYQPKIPTWYTTLLTSGLGLSGLFQKSLRVTQMLPAIKPGAVITQDNCQTRQLRPLNWNSLLCTAVQCYITISTGATYRKGQSIC
jgi:hypothetical protein